MCVHLTMQLQEFLRHDGRREHHIAFSEASERSEIHLGTDMDFTKTIKVSVETADAGIGGEGDMRPVRILTFPAQLAANEPDEIPQRPFEVII